MANWKYRINIRQYLGEGESQEDMHKAANGICKELTEKIPNHVLIRGARLMDSLKDAAKTGRLEWFNASLNVLWDWFDAERILVEL
jgi:hypothetical protein